MLRRLIPLALAITALVPTTAHASKTMEIGIQDDAVFVAQAGLSRQTGLDRAQEIGVTTVRANVIWWRALTDGQGIAHTRPATPRYDFSSYDALLADARSRGMKVEFTLVGPAPPWATKERNPSNRNPSAKDFGRFAAAVATHFRGKVVRYSVWNEPNWHTWLSPAKTAATQYRALYLAAYSAVKRADSKAQVLFGELAPQARGGVSYAPLRFMRDVLCVDKKYKKRKGCATVRADGVSIHPYDYKHAPSDRKLPADDVNIGTLSRLTSAVTKLRKAKALATKANREPPLHLTEFAYFASGSQGLRASTRARYLPQAFSLAQSNPKVAQMLYFGLLQNTGIQWNTGLLKPDGTPDAPFLSLKAWVAKNR